MEPPLRLSDLSYDAESGELVRPHIDTRRAPESALQTYLADARNLLDAIPADVLDEPASGALSAEFEHLRWFDLPAASLTP